MTSTPLSVAALRAGVYVTPPPGRVWCLEDFICQIREPTIAKVNSVTLTLIRNYVQTHLVKGELFLCTGAQAAAAAEEVDNWAWVRGQTQGIPGGTVNVVFFSNANPVYLTDQDALFVQVVLSTDGVINYFSLLLLDVTGTAGG